MADEGAVSVARRGNEWFSAAPFPTLRDTLLEAETLETASARLAEVGLEPIDSLIDPDIEIDMSAFAGGSILAENARGHAAFLRFWQEWLEPWDDMVVDIQNFTQLGEEGEHALVDVKLTGRGRIGGVPAELSACQLWTVRNGRAVRYSLFPTHDAAVAALEDGAAA